jgi:hypothetical protein
LCHQQRRRTAIAPHDYNDDKEMKLTVAFHLLMAQVVAAQYQPHYLVGLLNYPNSFIPDVLKNHTSGTYIPVGDEMWVSALNVPFTDVPGVGFSDMEFYYDDEGKKVLGEFYCLSDNGFGSSDNSADYPLTIHHLKIQKPFTYRHGESTFEKYTEVPNLGTALIHDPNNFIQWENGADIQGKHEKRLLGFFFTSPFHFHVSISSS